MNAANNAILASIDATGKFVTAADINCVNFVASGLSRGQFFQATAGAGTASAGQISYGATIAGTATAGAAGALPALPANYIIINVAGVTGKIPFYNS